jgi:hypothetical protein
MVMRKEVMVAAAVVSTANGHAKEVAAVDKNVERKGADCESWKGACEAYRHVVIFVNKNLWENRRGTKIVYKAIELTCSIEVRKL